MRRVKFVKLMAATHKTVSHEAVEHEDFSTTRSSTILASNAHLDHNDLVCCSSANDCGQTSYRMRNCALYKTKSMPLQHDKTIRGRRPENLYTVSVRLSALDAYENPTCDDSCNAKERSPETNNVKIDLRTRNCAPIATRVKVASSHDPWPASIMRRCTAQRCTYDRQRECSNVLKKETV